ncbi:unnamed protein product [Ectocarpus sp. 12 AP-2014]
MAKDSPKQSAGSSTAKKKAQHGGGGSGGTSVKREVKREVDTRVKSEKGEREEAVLKEKRKAGQKHATPPPGQADRCFYETLLKQKPESHMAQDWCLAHGVCGAAEADALYKRVCKRKGLQPLAHAPSLSHSPVKKAKRPSSGGKSRPRSSLPKEMDADTGFEASGAFEGVGTTGF